MGKALAIMLTLLTAMTVWMFAGQRALWFPENISTDGVLIDEQFARTSVVVGLAFVAVQLALAFAVWWFSRLSGKRSSYSRDVIHNFFVPAMRIKQDIVPGLTIRLHFTATRPGKYEIPCAELCGNGHYKMKSWMIVVPADEYTAMEKLSKAEFRARVDAL